MKTIDLIKKQVSEGILGPELSPEPRYWHWPVLKPELLDERLKENYDGREVRWYGSEWD